MLDVIMTLIPQDSKLISVYQSGSSLYYDSPKDIDYFVIIDKGEPYSHIANKEKGIDLFIYTEERFEELLKMDDKYIFVPYVFAIFLNKHIYGKEYQIALNEKFFNCEKMFFNATYKKIKNKTCKFLWYYLVPIYMIEHDNYVFTDELKNIARQCHDNTIDRSFIDYVDDYLNNERYKAKLKIATYQDDKNGDK